MRFLCFVFSILWHFLIIGLLIYYPLHTPSINLTEKHIYEVELIKLSPIIKKTKPKAERKHIRNKRPMEKKRIFYPRKPAFVKNVPPPVSKKRAIEIPAKNAKRIKKVKKKISSLPSPSWVKKSILARALRDITKEAEQEQKQKSIVEEEVKKLERQSIQASVSQKMGYNMELYLKIAEQKIKQNWRYPVVTGPSLKAQVQIVVDKEGKILSYKMLKSSGRKDFDNSVIKSIRETKVLPPPPSTNTEVKIIISFMSENNP